VITLLISIGLLSSQIARAQIVVAQTQIAARDNAIADTTMRDLNGKLHQLSDYRGKWLVVNFWATWCPPCLEEMPDLVMLYDQRKANLMVIGIAQDYQNEKQVRDFIDDMLVSYPIVLSNAKIKAQFGKVELLPTSLIYNPNGELVYTKRGAITRRQIEQIMDGAKKISLLNNSGRFIWRWANNYACVASMLLPASSNTFKLFSCAKCINC
jgi:thiol-disulfide isomerase/thioredoxin